MRLTTPGSLVLASVLCLCACGSGTKTSSGAGGTGSGSTAAAGKPTTATTGASMTTTSVGTMSTGAGMNTTGAGMTTTGTGMNPGCTVTMSGIVSGTFPCSVVAAYNTSQNRSAIGFTLASGASYPMGVMTSTGGGPVTGQFMTQTYANADFLSGAGYLTVLSAGYSVVGSSKDKGVGTQSLTLTSVAVGVQNANGNTYTVHGTFDSTGGWVNGPMVSGTETIHIDF